jgi:hypothetical protein
LKQAQGCCLGRGGSAKGQSKPDAGAKNREGAGAILHDWRNGGGQWREGAVDVAHSVRGLGSCSLVWFGQSRFLIVTGTRIFQKTGWFVHSRSGRPNRPLGPIFPGLWRVENALKDLRN